MAPDYVQTIRQHVVDAPAQSVFFAPLTKIPEAVPAADRERIVRDGTAAIRESVLPAYGEFLAFMSTDYLPKVRPTVGLSDVPGGRHHTQIMLHYENRTISELRRQADVTAFVEGWALYAERLGLEVGFYTDPYSDFGRLTYEIWRACRLVVDTGIHAFGWTRQRAIEYMTENTALSVHEVTTEVDRYIRSRGQALAYKMGELRITAARRRAEQALGAKFDVRDFHDAVLSQGSVPLVFLDRQVDQWIGTVKAKSQ